MQINDVNQSVRQPQQLGRTIRQAQIVIGSAEVQPRARSVRAPQPVDHRSRFMRTYSDARARKACIEYLSLTNDLHSSRGVRLHNAYIMHEHTCTLMRQRAHFKLTNAKE